MIDSRTPHFDLPLPDSSNLLSEDVGRIGQALTGIDEAMYAQQAAQAAFADQLQSQVDQQLQDAAAASQTASKDLSQTVDTQLAKLKILALAGL